MNESSRMRNARNTSAFLGFRESSLQVIVPELVAEEIRPIVKRDMAGNRMLSATDAA
jgi:hypothetical protein